ncbi:sulfate permease [Diaporthe helianthi]|uniref:Sulfate permease n=1 Tax=Diaporthe helianthi TaxID=158607 RepID=A0A2P5I1N8_DIAHE|nr:sulfate permease [Diaporthe helianthi]
MDKFRKKGEKIKHFFKTDWNIVRAKRYARRSGREIRYGAGRYLANKFPIVQWIASYSPKWLFGDVISGITVGIVLALQAVNLPSSAGGVISTQQTLIASWLPGFIYALTGSSKHISIGPTSAGNLLSLQIIGPFAEAARIPPFIVLPALTFCVGIWFLLFGVLGLGFLFDLIPISICLAGVGVIALNLVLVQVPTFLGLHGIPPIVPAIPPAIIQRIGDISLRTLAISISAIFFLAALRFVSNKWGKKKSVAGKAAQFGSNMSSILVVLIFTIVSFLFLQSLPITEQVVSAAPPTLAAGGPATTPVPETSLPQTSVNTTSAGAAQFIIPAKRDEPLFDLVAELHSGNTGSSVQTRAEPLPDGQPSSVSDAAAAASAAPAGGAPQQLPKLPFWAVFPVFTATIVSPLPPIIDIVKALFLPSLLVFIVLNIEHLVIARTFGHYHTYTISENSEMFATGLSNLAGAFFGGVPVGGGDMARSSLLAVTGAKSPLNQIFTSLTVLVAMMPLSGALRFLPQAALSAIIVVAVVGQQPPQKLLGDYFRLSFADFLAFFLAFNIAIFIPAVGIAVGTAVGVGLMVLYTLFRGMFSRPRSVSAHDLESMYKEKEFRPWQEGDPIPRGTHVVKLGTEMVWTNAARFRRHIVDACMVHNSGVPIDSREDKPERPWNFRIHEHVAALRRQRNIMLDDDDSESLISHHPLLRVVVLDMTSLREWAGEGVEFRFVGLNARVLKRFERAKWEVLDPYGPSVVEAGEEHRTSDLRFDHLPLAIHYMNTETTLSGMWEEVAVAMGENIDKIEKAYV